MSLEEMNRSDACCQFCFCSESNPNGYLEGVTKWIAFVSCPNHSSGLPAEAASLECGDFYGFKHNIEAIQQIQMDGSGEPADFVFETDRV